MAVHISQSEAPSLKSVGELLMVDAHEVQHGRLDVMHRDGVLDDVVAEVVGQPEAGALVHALSLIHI